MAVAEAPAVSDGVAVALAPAVAEAAALAVGVAVVPLQPDAIKVTANAAATHVRCPRTALISLRPRPFNAVSSSIGTGRCPYYPTSVGRPQVLRLRMPLGIPSVGRCPGASRRLSRWRQVRKFRRTSGFSCVDLPGSSEGAPSDLGDGEGPMPSYCAVRRQRAERPARDSVRGHSLVAHLGDDQLLLCQAAARVTPSTLIRAASSACSRRKTSSLSRRRRARMASVLVSPAARRLAT